jgi:glutathione S-transferase
VRWALDHKWIPYNGCAQPPGVHIAVAAWLTRGRQFTLPVLQLEGRRIGDSTAIIAALEKRFGEPPLYPADPDERAHALELEEWFDEELGPAARRFAFHEATADRERFAELAAPLAPPPLARFKRLNGAYGRVLTAVRYGAASDEGADRAREKLLATLERLEEELDGNPYLVGDRFTVADLTAAALFYPVVLPPEGPVDARLMPESLLRFRASLEDRPGLRWIEDMFRRHRRPAAAPAVAVGAGI